MDDNRKEDKVDKVVLSEMVQDLIRVLDDPLLRYLPLRCPECGFPWCDPMDNLILLKGGLN